MFEIYVSYSQITVFTEALEDPFNDWSERHVDQGFSWRENSVSFKTIKEDGNISIILRVKDEFTPQSRSQRIIRVPFEVPENGMVEIASITDGQRIQVPSGKYSLYYETYLKRKSNMAACFTFCRRHIDEPKIVKSDSEVKEPDEYLMKAEPA